jgi:hypothetical protein
MEAINLKTRLTHAGAREFIRNHLRGIREQEKSANRPREFRS